MMALCGYVTLFNTPILHGGIWKMLLPGCFDRSLKSGRTIELLLNHQPELCVGTTRDILQLHSDSVGLAMRARLPATREGKSARWMGEHNHDDASVGFGWDTARKETRRVGGRDVVCILDAELVEVSYLFGSGLGAVKESFITYRDCDFTKSLREECCSYLYEGAALNVTRSLQKLIDA